MTDQTMWVIVILTAVIAAVIGFFVGRTFGNSKRHIAMLEEEVKQHKETLAHYKQDVKEHFDHTATLFVSMAGSYKELFEHLSKGYESLADGSVRDMLKARFDTLLQDVGAQNADTDSTPSNIQADSQTVVVTDVVAAVEEGLYTSSVTPPADYEQPREQDNTDEAMPVLDDIVSDENISATEDAERTADTIDFGRPAAMADEQADTPENVDRREPSISGGESDQTDSAHKNNQ